MDGFKAKHILYDDWLDPDTIRARCDANSGNILELTENEDGVYEYSSNISCTETEFEEYMKSLKKLAKRLMDDFNTSDLYSELVLMCNMSEHVCKHHDRMFGKYYKMKNGRVHTTPIFVRPKSKLPYIRKKF